jgi:purine-binding chemotaxis protein CheW
MSATTSRNQAHDTEYVSVTIGDQLFGLPIGRVQDVFVADRMTKVPLAPPEVAGILSLRGRLVTVIDMRARLDLGARDPSQPPVSVGIEIGGEFYGLLVDRVGDVIQISAEAMAAKPANLDPGIEAVSTGVCWLKDRLLVVLDVDRILNIKTGVQVAA